MENLYFATSEFERTLSFSAMVKDRFSEQLHEAIHRYAKLHHIELQSVTLKEVVITALEREDTIAVACTGGYGSPFTNTSHFLVLAGVDDEYLYILDPLRRDDYGDLDRNGYLEVIRPGLVRVKLENASHCNLRPIYLMQPEAAS